MDNLLPGVDAEDTLRCDNCSYTDKAPVFEPVKDLGSRVMPGGIMPAAECPECGALAYLEPKPKTDAKLDRSPVPRVIIYREGGGRIEAIDADVILGPLQVEVRDYEQEDWDGSEPIKVDPINGQAYASVIQYCRTREAMDVFSYMNALLADLVDGFHRLRDDFETREPLLINDIGGQIDQTIEDLDRLQQAVKE